MLSHENISLLRNVCRLMHFIGELPLHWKVEPSGTEIALLKKCRKYRLLSKVNLCVLLFYECFLACRLTIVLLQVQRSNSAKNASHLSIVLQLVWNLLSYSLPFSINQMAETTNFLSEFLRYFNKLQAEYITKQEPHWKSGCERKLKGIVSTGCLICVVNSILLIRKPEQPFFITSLLEDPKTTSKLRIFPVMLVQAWIWVILWSNIFFATFLHLSYTYAVVHLLRQFRRKFVPREGFVEMGRAYTFMRNYRELQTLHSQFNANFQDFFMPVHKMIGMCISVIGIFGGIRIHGPRAVTMAVGATLALLYLTLVFRRLGKLYEESMNTLHSWKCEKRKYIRKFIRSSLPIRVEVGVYYFVKKTTVIVIWYTVFNYTTNLLLSSK